MPTQKFKPIRGVRQGCLLSPYFSVLCMEWLGDGIHSTISSGKWSPIKLSRSRPELSHLFFIDDLVIFSKADLEHVLILKETLDWLCSLLGH